MNHQELARLELACGALSSGVDADGNWVLLERGGGAPEVVRLPRWLGGVGGMELVASNDERFVALLIYSGQSSQGFEVFSLDAGERGLAHIGGLPEGEGRGSAPVFSPGATWLVTLIDVARTDRGSGEWFEEIQDDHATDRVIVEWARLEVMRLPSAELTRTIVATDIRRSMNVDEVYEWAPYDVVRFTGENAIALDTPWGESVPVQLPCAELITCRVP